MSVPRAPIDIFGHKVRPLTLGQVERLEGVFQPRDPPYTNVQMAREAVKVALSRDHASIDPDEIECDVASLGAAMKSIMDLAGMLPQGEAPAAAGNAHSGETSEDA